MPSRPRPPRPTIRQERAIKFAALMADLRVMLDTAPKGSLEEFRLERTGGWLIAAYGAWLTDGEQPGTWVTLVEADPATHQLHLVGADPEGDTVCLGLWDRLPEPEDLPLSPSDHCATLAAQPITEEEE